MSDGVVISLTEHIRVYQSDNADRSNACILGHSTDLLLIDTIAPPQATNFVRAIQRMGNPLFILHNHCHLDHCEGDSFFPQSGVLLFGDQKQMIEIEMQRFPMVQWPKYLLALPCGEMQFYDMRIQIEQTGGHSFDTVYFYLPDYKILLAGENVANGREGGKAVPHISLFGQACRMLRAIHIFQSLDVQVLVPAHGETVFAKNCQQILADNALYLTNLIQHAERVYASDISREHLDELCPPLSQIIADEVDLYTSISHTFHQKNWMYLMTQNQVSGQCDKPRKNQCNFTSSLSVDGSKVCPHSIG